MVNTGYKQSLFFGNEVTFGSAAAVDQGIGLVQAVNPTETNNLIKVRTLGGTRDYANIVPGKFEISGSFDYYLQEGSFLRQAFGEDTATTATIDSGPKFHTGATSYLHVMGSAESPLAASFPSFTLELADAEDAGDPGTYNLKRDFTGCRVNTLSVSGSVDEPVSVTCDWLAQGVTISTAAASSVTESTANPYVFYQGAVYATSGAVTAYTPIEGTAAIAEVNTFDFSVNNNLEAVWYVSGTTNIYQTKRGAKEILAKGRDYEGSLGLHFANKTQYERFLGTTAATQSQETLQKYQVALDFIKSGTLGVSPKLVTDEWIRVVMRNTKFADINIPGGPEDIVAQNIGLDFEGATCYVVDDDASYKA